DLGAQIAPTGTTASNYINGTLMSFENFYASQGGDIQYTDTSKQRGVVASANPGVLEYFTGLSSEIKADANGDGKPDTFTIRVDQSNNNSGWPLFTTTKTD